MPRGEGWATKDLALYWRYVATFREDASRSERLWREANEVRIAAFLTDQTSASATPSEAVWETVMLLIQTAPDDDALCWLGAGPVEDLAVHHGEAFIDQFVLAAQRTVPGCASLFLAGRSLKTGSRRTRELPMRPVATS